MSRAMAATKGGELNSQINRLILDGTAYLSAGDFVVRRFEHEIDKLAKVDALGASLCRSSLSMLIGDWPMVQHWTANMRHLGAVVEPLGVEFIASSNLGYFTPAAALYPQVMDVRWGVTAHFLTHGLICGAFADVIAGNATCSEGKIELGVSQQRAVEVAMNAQALLARLGVSEQEVQAMLDVAGEVLREQKLFWLGTDPSIAVLDSDEGAGLLYQLPIAVDAQQASELSDQVIMRMIERDLDMPGLAFSFLSTPPAPVGQ